MSHYQEGVKYVVEINAVANFMVISSSMLYQFVKGMEEFNPPKPPFPFKGGLKNSGLCHNFIKTVIARG